MPLVLLLNFFYCTLALGGRITAANQMYTTGLAYIFFTQTSRLSLDEISPRHQP